MAQAVVHFLEFVQIDEHYRERPPGARGAFPLRSKRLPEKAPSLDAGQPVRNRLLLQFLKHDRVVQRRGQQVSQRIHD